MADVTMEIVRAEIGETARLDIKNQIILLLLSTKREGMQELIDHMEEQGFFNAPCSTQYHLAKEGGLAEHSLNVYNSMVKTAYGTDFLDAKLTINKNSNSIKIVSLLHDLGKMGHHGKPNYVPKTLKDGSPAKKAFETNKELLYVPHEIASLMIAEKFIQLTEEESFSIFYHNGLYVPSGRDLNGKEIPLQMLLHFADMWCSRVVEVDHE